MTEAAGPFAGQRVLVTGATGFVGTPVVGALLAGGAQVTALCRDAARAAAWPYADRVELVSGGLDALSGARLDDLAGHGRILHLAWERLDAYKDEAHMTEVLPRHLKFLRELVARGARRLLVAGTCLEYGLREGRLSEDMEPLPTTAYGRAKDALRRELVPLCAAAGTRLVWARLFYMHGPGQSGKSLLSQIDRAINTGAASFNMSGGAQERDYLPVGEVAGLLVRLAFAEAAQGVVNCASGRPVTVRALVEERLRLRGARLALNLGHYPYPDYEPMRFWADTGRLAAALSAEPGADAAAPVTDAARGRPRRA